MHTELLGEIYLSGAGFLLLSREDARLKPMVKNYEKLLRLAGKDFVKKKSIGPLIASQLQKPIFTADEYAEYANKMWDQVLTNRRLVGVAT